MSDTPTFDRWWNETGSNEYDVSTHHTLREGWRACITHRAVPLWRELSIVTTERDMARIREDSAKRELSAARERIAELEKENKDQKLEIKRLQEYLNP